MNAASLACLLAAAGFAFAAEPPLELGPLRTRDLFPLYLVGQGYQPVAPSPLGEGRWRFDVHAVRSNTFEFSDALRDRFPRDPQGRIQVNRAVVEAHARELADLPMVFFFDEEISRVEFEARRGLGAHTDVWIQWPIQSHYGGWLDAVIEGVHKLGFKQFGRDFIAKDQLTLLVLEHGQVTFFTQDRIKAKPQDPTVGLVHQVWKDDRFEASVSFSLKPPLTTTYAVYRSGWDPTISLTTRWQPNPRWVSYVGAGFLWRTRGSAAYNETQVGGFRNLAGGHLGLEWRCAPRIRPFFQLLLQSGWLRSQQGQTLDRPSLQHDLGLHWIVRPKTVLSFRYINNITHFGNTADMALGLSLTFRP